MKWGIKKALALSAAILLLALTSCSGEEDGRNVIVITERFFVNQLDEILLNHRAYIGRYVRYEGMFFTVPWDGYDFHIVYRYTIHCCGELDRVGFEVVMDDFEPFPNDAWVEVLGMVDTIDGFLVLRVISISELDERGSEFVF